MNERNQGRTGVERAAILLLTLGESEAAEILKHMGAKDVQRLCRTVAQQTGAPEAEILGLITFVKDRPGHDLRYAIDSTKLREQLGWQPALSDFEAGLARTIEWYQAHESWWRPSKRDVEATYAAKGQ